MKKIYASWVMTIIWLGTLTACDGQDGLNETGAQNGGQYVSEPMAKTPDGRNFVSSAIIFEKFKKGVLFCYGPETNNSCKSIQYSETVKPSEVVTISVRKWDFIQKQVVRDRQFLKGDYICVTTDHWSADNSSYYITVDDIAKIQPTDINPEPEKVERWRKDLKDRWAGVMGHEFCYRYALRPDAKGETHNGEFEEFKFSSGVLQPLDEPAYLNTYERADLGNLKLRPQN